MSFNSKNLHYEKKEPAFLRRLRGQDTGKRHNAPVARPRKPRLETEDDDGPTIVNEQGENVTEQEYQSLCDGRNSDDSAVRNGSSAESSDSTSGLRTQSDRSGGKTEGHDIRCTAVNSGPRKRKQPKAVAEEAEPEANSFKAEHGSLTTEENGKPMAKTTLKKKKKKKIKLSFDDHEA